MTNLLEISAREKGRQESREESRRNLVRLFLRMARKEFGSVSRRLQKQIRAAKSEQLSDWCYNLSTTSDLDSLVIAPDERRPWRPPERNRSGRVMNYFERIAYEEGYKEGLELARQERQQVAEENRQYALEFFLHTVKEKFHKVPKRLEKQIQTATIGQIGDWCSHLKSANDLDALINPPAKE